MRRAWLGYCAVRLARAIWDLLLVRHYLEDAEYAQATCSSRLSQYCRMTFVVVDKASPGARSDRRDHTGRWYTTSLSYKVVANGFTCRTVLVSCETLLCTWKECETEAPMIDRQQPLPMAPSCRSREACCPIFFLSLQAPPPPPPPRALLPTSAYREATSKSVCHEANGSVSVSTTH